MSKKIIVIIIVALISGGAFYGGIKYAESKNLHGQLPSLNPPLGEKDGRMRDSEATMERGFRGVAVERGENAEFLAGEIISKDNESITLSLREGGSRILFFSDSTEIIKTIKGSLDDLEIGQSVNVNGVASPDGSVSAELIQIR